MTEMYDLVVIGGGSAGLIAADFAAKIGVRVALVEKHRIGGDCTWTGCVPSKTFLKAAKVAHHMRTADRFGLPRVQLDVDLTAVMAHVREVIAGVYQFESPEVLREEGIDVHLGPARFVDAHTLSVGDTRLTARYVLLATGAHPLIPPVSGLGEVRYLTYETIWDLEVLPKRLIVVGAGPIGSELAQGFRRLGSKVAIVVSRDRVLPRDDPDASRLIGEVFSSEGIELFFNSRAERVWQDPEGIHLVAGDHELHGDALLIAAGRRPNVDGLNLDRAGVLFSERGIQA